MAGDFVDPTISATPTPPAPKMGGRMEFVDPSTQPSLTQGPIPSSTYGGAPKPVIADDMDLGASNLEIARASLAPNVKDQIKRYADFFKVPESYFGVVNGEVVRWVPEKSTYAKVVPTMGGGSGFLDTASRALPQTASQFGPTLPGVAGAVAGTVMGPTGMSIPAAGAAAGATDLVRQSVDRILAGEPFYAVDPLNSAGHALLNAGGQATAFGLNRAVTRNPLGVEAYDRIAAMDPQRQAETAAVNAEAKRRGINLTTGQATGLPSIMSKERQLGRFPETTDAANEKTIVQRTTEVPNAFRDELGNISPVAGRENQVGAFRDAGDAVLQRSLAERNAQAQIAYRNAFEGKGRFWNEDVEALMQRPSMQRAIAAAKKLAAEKGEDITVPVFDKGKIVGRDVVPDWKSWDYIKQGLDRVIEENTNEFGKLNQYGQAVYKTKQALLGNLDKANPDYAIARGLYGADSEVVGSVLNGGVGLLNSMKGMDRQQIVNRIFSGGNLLPEDITKMRGQFAMAGKLNDWHAGLRGYLEGALDNALKANVTGGVPGNVPGKLYSGLWGDPQQKAVLVAALGDKAKVESFEGLMSVLQRASRVLPEGSPTATDLGAGQTKTVAGKVVGMATSPMSWANMGNEVVDLVNAIRQPGARVKLAEYLLTGEGTKDLQKFRMLSPTSQRALTATTHILENAGIIATGMRAPSDFEPPVARELRNQPIAR